MEEILLSVVIPTYNRYKYLIGSIESIIETISTNNYEIIIEDNTENNKEILDYLDKVNDIRIKYYHEKNRRTVSENCSSAITHAKGKYVCLIGDDDSICSSMLDLVDCMDKYKIDACNFDVAIYHWNDLRTIKPKLDALISPISSASVELRDAKGILEKELERGMQKIYELPRAYHAVISKKVLDIVYDKVGTYFPGPSPDMANAVLCSIYVKNQIKIGTPMMVSGYGAGSTGGLGRQKKHKGSLKGKDWLPKDVEEKWDKKIPLLWNGCTIWPASAVEALYRAGEKNYLSKMNYGIIYGETILQSKFEGLKAVFKCKPSCYECYSMISHILKRVVLKVAKKIHSSSDDKIINNQVNSLKEATFAQNRLNSKVDIYKMFEMHFLG